GQAAQEPKGKHSRQRSKGNSLIFLEEPGYLPFPEDQSRGKAERPGIRFKRQQPLPFCDGGRSPVVALLHPWVDDPPPSITADFPPFFCFPWCISRSFPGCFSCCFSSCFPSCFPSCLPGCFPNMYACRAAPKLP